MYYPMYYRMDPTYVLVLIGVVLSLLASAKVKSTFAKYQRVRNYAGLTGREAAERVLHGAGIYDVRIERVSGSLTDHYDPQNKVLRLSDSTYNSASVAAVGVAAHECGHAIQHAVNYAPIRWRGALVPVANFGSTIAWPLILIGLFFTPPTSSGDIMPLLPRIRIARLEASNSTGSVTRWNSTAAENARIPRLISREEEFPVINSPISISGHAIVEPKFATGTKAPLQRIGA